MRNLITPKGIAKAVQAAQDRIERNREQIAFLRKENAGLRSISREAWLAGGKESELHNTKLIYRLEFENERLSQSMARLRNHLERMNRLLRSKAVTSLKKGLSKFRRAGKPLK